jgi:hypothetical protein
MPLSVIRKARLRPWSCRLRSSAKGLSRKEKLAVERDSRKSAAALDREARAMFVRRTTKRGRKGGLLKSGRMVMKAAMRKARKAKK